MGGRFIDVNPSPDNLRAIWNLLHTIDKRQAAILAAQTAHDVLLTSLQAQMTTTAQLAQQAQTSVSASTAETDPGQGGDTPSDGPVVPPPGTPPPPPAPNQPPIQEAISAGDIIPIGGITWHNSPDPSGFGLTASLTKLDWSASGVHVEHSKQTDPGSWPDQTTPGWTGPLQYTLWVVLKIAGVYHGSGIIQFWRGLDRNGGPPSGFAANWVYDPSRWGPMAHYQPAYGENVWMLVTAGDARNGDFSAVHERSQIVQISFPSNAGGIYSL